MKPSHPFIETNPGQNGNRPSSSLLLSLWKASVAVEGKRWMDATRENPPTSRLQPTTHQLQCSHLLTDFARSDNKGEWMPRGKKKQRQRLRHRTPPLCLPRSAAATEMPTYLDDDERNIPEDEARSGSGPCPMELFSSFLLPPRAPDTLRAKWPSTQNSTLTVIDNVDRSVRTGARPQLRGRGDDVTGSPCPLFPRRGPPG